MAFIRYGCIPTKIVEDVKLYPFGTQYHIVVYLLKL